LAECFETGKLTVAIRAARHVPGEVPK
jgi:hypothetical protein